MDEVETTSTRDASRSQTAPESRILLSLGTFSAVENRVQGLLGHGMVRMRVKGSTEW